MWSFELSKPLGMQTVAKEEPTVIKVSMQTVA